VALIKFAFERLDGPAPFSDAVCLTQEEADALQPGDMEALQEARFQAWLLAISPPAEG
jgi:hypothetical protein